MHPVVAATARELLNKSENERSGVLSTAVSFLGLYRDPVVSRNTESCDWRIADLVSADKPVTLYLVVPPSDISRTKPLIRLILNQIGTYAVDGQLEQRRVLGLSAERTGRGLALDWPQYSKGKYASAQREADRSGRGMWAGSYVEPWLFHGSRQHNSGKSEDPWGSGNPTSWWCTIESATRHCAGLA